MNKACLLLIFLTTSATAQEVTEQMKKSALMQAYRMNGNSMVGWGSIDLTGRMREDPMECTVQYGASTGKTFFDCPQPRSVKTEKIEPKESFENRVLVPPPPQKRTR